MFKRKPSPGCPPTPLTARCPWESCGEGWKRAPPLGSHQGPILAVIAGSGVGESKGRVLCSAFKLQVLRRRRRAWPGAAAHMDVCIMQAALRPDAGIPLPRRWLLAPPLVRALCRVLRGSGAVKGESRLAVLPPSSAGSYTDVPSLCSLGGKGGWAGPVRSTRLTCPSQGVKAEAWVR